MVVAHIGRIADQKIVAGIGGFFCEVRKVNVEGRLSPQFSRGLTIMGVNLNAARYFDTLARKRAAERGVEGASSDSRIEKTNRLIGRKQRPGVGQYIERERGRRSKLAKLISFQRSLFSVQLSLQFKSFLLQD